MDDRTAIVALVMRWVRQRPLGSFAQLASEDVLTAVPPLPAAHHHAPRTL
ncbi:MAG: hypothetical protein H6658_10010 [Ardenticatenaceae bacterium]|nr:hypothetical protein [Ardenticatenaceae bacterium]